MELLPSAQSKSGNKDYVSASKNLKIEIELFPWCAISHEN